MVVATLREAVQAGLLLSRGIVAGLTVGRDSAVVDTPREKAHAEQRVADRRSSFEGQLVRLRTDLENAQAEAREQRTRADRAEGRTP